MELKGKKTYIIGVVLIIYALTGAFVGKHDWNTAFAEILVALGMLGLRNSIPLKK